MVGRCSWKQSRLLSGAGGRLWRQRPTRRSPIGISPADVRSSASQPVARSRHARNRRENGTSSAPRPNAVA